MDSSPGFPSDLRCHNTSARLSSDTTCSRSMLDMCVKKLFQDDSMQERSTDDILTVHDTCISRILDSPNDSPQVPMYY